MKALIVSGLSGSGKSTFKAALEDLGYYTIDNLPLQLLEDFLSLALHSHQISKVAVVMDMREKNFASKFPAVFNRIREQGMPVDLVFLEASEEVLRRRYGETRRTHPLSPEAKPSEGIKLEKKLMQPVRALASHVIDTSAFNVHQLKAFVKKNFGADFLKGRMHVYFVSFGYKYGVPDNLSLLFDVRFLPNPFFKSKYKNLKGTDERVAKYVLRSREARGFMARAVDMVKWLVPRYEKEGKAYCSIGVGCTGGRHRSVAVVEAMVKRLRWKGERIHIEHRDVDKEG